MSTFTFPKDTHPQRVGQDWSIRTSTAANEILFYGGNASAAEIETMNKVMWNDEELLTLPLKFQIIAKLVRNMIRTEALMIAIAGGDVGVDEPSQFVFLALQDIYFLQGLLVNADAVNAFERKATDNPTPHPGANEDVSRIAMAALERAMVVAHPELKKLPLGSGVKQAKELAERMAGLTKRMDGGSFSVFDNYSAQGKDKK